MAQAAPDSPTVAAGWKRYAAISLLLLIPVFWQSRVQAGDLSSHIYNTWLAQLIENGKVQGLAVVTQHTNVLFDLMLSALFGIGGAGFAQRAAVSVAVLVFSWGVFGFMGAVAGRRCWHLMPCVAILAYGWVYHMGLFNFYLSMGLSCWGLSLMWPGTRRRVVLGAVLLGVAYVGHALPVAWAGGVAFYSFAARRISPRARAGLTALCFLAMILIHVALARVFPTRWSAGQLKTVTGADQAWVFDAKYFLVAMGLLTVWGLLLSGLVRSRGARTIFSGEPFHIFLLSAGVVFLMPSAVQLPGYHHSLTFIAERMSLAVGLSLCAVLAAGSPSRAARISVIAVAVVFFAFLYRDEGRLNSIEDRVDGAVAGVQPGARVLSALADPSMRGVSLGHMIDRACIGRCFSYANYEASTAQFRVRVVRENPYVVADYEDSWEMQIGKYVVKANDPPLEQVYLDGAGRMALRRLQAGTPCGLTSLKALPDLLPKG